MIAFAAWATEYAACTECGGTASPHHARGLCYRCYMRAANARWREEHADDYRAYHRLYQPEWLKRPTFEATLGATDAGRENFQRLGLKCCSENDYALWHAAATRARPGQECRLSDFCRDCCRPVAEDMREQGRCVNPRRFK